MVSRNTFHFQEFSRSGVHPNSKTLGGDDVYFHTYEIWFASDVDLSGDQETKEKTDQVRCYPCIRLHVEIISEITNFRSKTKNKFGHLNVMVV